MNKSQNPSAELLNHNAGSTQDCSTSTWPSLFQINSSEANWYHFSSFLSTSVRSVVPKIEDLVVNSFNADIVSVTESWLNDNAPNDLISFQGYTILRRDRLDGRSGGRLGCFC